jgi:hypothetical protein
VFIDCCIQLKDPLLNLAHYLHGMV